MVEQLQKELVLKAEPKLRVEAVAPPGFPVIAPAPVLNPLFGSQGLPIHVS